MFGTERQMRTAQLTSMAASLPRFACHIVAVESLAPAAFPRRGEAIVRMSRTSSRAIRASSTSSSTPPPSRIS